MTDNTAPGTGGGISCDDSSFTAIQSSLIDNQVGQIESTTIEEIGIPTDPFYRRTVTSIGNGLGGGCFAQSSSITMLACRVTGNISHSDGGGLFGQSSKSCRIHATLFHDNEAIRTRINRKTKITIGDFRITSTEADGFSDGSGGGILRQFASHITVLHDFGKPCRMVGRRY